MVEILASNLDELLREIRQCSLSEGSIPAPNPVLRASASAKILIVGQAPGTRVHASGIPWNDPSGDKLRDWLQLDSTTFYDESLLAIVPMGFCYPGKGKSGDLPPRSECAATWHEKIMALLPNIQCTLLIGQYARSHYLTDNFVTLTERVLHWQEFAPAIYVLPHPSPRNRIWLKRNPWFEAEVLPHLQSTINSIVSN